ncbi:MAG TPA: ABC transporter ATP-binding protein [Solirubrobacteraceae bacterium]|nr:ABC transporter ATP-binding protein [Solirubrobacteraceae bacterium]
MQTQTQSREGQAPPARGLSQAAAAKWAGDAQSDHAVRLDAVSHAYEDRRGSVIQALAGVSLHAPRGSVLAVVGPSGCGKTTLLELICGLQQPDAGTVECDQAVLMPQRDLLLPWLSAVDNAALALRIAGDSRARARTRGAALFEELGLSGFERARPRELSGGMRQRVAFLRTLLSGKPLLCLDEPLSALDAITRQEMQEWLTGALLREPRTVMIVTHDVEEAIVLADRVAVLSPRPGRVVAELTVGLPRPRKRTDPEVLALREQAMRALQMGASVGDSPSSGDSLR